MLGERTLEIPQQTHISFRTKEKTFSSIFSVIDGDSFDILLGNSFIVQHDGIINIYDSTFRLFNHNLETKLYLNVSPVNTPPRRNRVCDSRGPFAEQHLTCASGWSEREVKGKRKEKIQNTVVANANRS